MQVRVFQFWNGRDAVIREVDVPAEEVEKVKAWAAQVTLGKEPPEEGVDTETATKNRLLNLVYYYGQNDFQPRPAPSVSVGDIIEFKLEPTSVAEHWVVASFGFMNFGREKHFIFDNKRDPQPAAG